MLCVYAVSTYFHEVSLSYTSNEVERGVYWFHLFHPSVRLSVRLSCCGFVHTERRPSELGISMRAEVSKNISHWFSRFVSDSVTLDMLLESDGNFGEVIKVKNWYSSGLSILVWHTCASALSGWVLYRQLELTKLTCPDLHHAVGLFILRDVRLWTESCPLCIINNTRRIHFIFARLIKQLQKVCRV